MSDFLIDNKPIYTFELFFLNGLNFITMLVGVLFLIGVFTNKPLFLVEINEVVRFLLGLFLVYRFNSYRKQKIIFTELDKKICFSTGVYIITYALGEYITFFSDIIRFWVSKLFLPIIGPIKQQLSFFSLGRIWKI